METLKPLSNQVSLKHPLPLDSLTCSNLSIKKKKKKKVPLYPTSYSTTTLLELSTHAMAPLPGFHLLLNSLTNWSSLSCPHRCVVTAVTYMTNDPLTVNIPPYWGSPGPWLKRHHSCPPGPILLSLNRGTYCPPYLSNTRVPQITFYITPFLIYMLLE